MDFINKLIKKGIFTLVLCFSFFTVFSGEKIFGASDCTIEINDGNKYLVLNTEAGWSDSGVSIYCEDVDGEKIKQENVSVSINGSDPVATIDSGRDISNTTLTNSGFYKIKYFLTSDSSVNITRQVRVLPGDLNSVRNIWPGEFSANTTEDDVFVKIVDNVVKRRVVVGDSSTTVNDTYYLSIGNFGTTGYVTYFNSFGEYVWHEEFANTTLKDIVKSGDESGRIYFLVGQNANGKGFVKIIQLNTDKGINDSYGMEFEFSSVDEEEENLTVANKVIVSSSFIYVGGYLTNKDGSNTGKIVRLTNTNNATLSNAIYFTNPLESEYNSIVATQIDSQLKILAVGTTAVENYGGANGGLITVCSENLSSCTTKNPYFWQNSNGASTTTTNFNDVIRVGENYLIVGKSRVDRILSKSVSNTSGGEDALVVLLNSSLEVIDAKLIGSSSVDELYSIKEISTKTEFATGVKTYQYVSVGKRASQAIYCFITVVGNEENGYALSTEENSVSGRNGTVQFRDVFVKKDAGEEINYIFVGTRQAAVIEDVFISEKSANSQEALLMIYDATPFINYGDINVLQGATICEGGSKTCSADKLYETYRMQYGATKVVLSSSENISSEVVKVISGYHNFKNAQGIVFIIGREVIVSATPVAPNIEQSVMGIDKWYLYSRTQSIGQNVSLKDREEMWTNRYIPVDNNLTKNSKETYYVISGGEFVEDTSSRTYTYNNYIKMAEYVLVEDGEVKKEDIIYYVLKDGKYVVDNSTSTTTSGNYIAVEESLNTTRAFQSIEAANEYAQLQEFARVAFVKSKYNYDLTGINAFQGETANLSTQNYYFIYYIDLSITGTAGCGTLNGVLYGTCNEYTGYAFASLTRIKEIANLIVKKYNYFVSESNNRFNPTSGLNITDTSYFKQEMSTEAYVTSKTINLTENLYLEVTHYPVVEEVNKYSFSATYNVSTVVGKNSVVFSKDENADYREEGKYVVRYCYNYGQANQSCGESSTFVIDRKAPIVNYNLTNENKGSITTSTSPTNPFLVNTSMMVSAILDIDPYAYTLIDGVKYYLQCNEIINSSSCIANIADYVNKSYSYDKENPNKVFNIVVYDRAGNFISSYFKIGTVMPKVSVEDNSNGDSFILGIDFYERNAIDSFIVSYTKSEQCSANACTDANKLQNSINTLMSAYIYNNELERQKQKEDPEYEPIIIYGIDLTFSLSRVNADGSIVGGLVIPKVEVSSVEGKTVYTFVENAEEVLAVSKGLYKFTLGDSFYNISEAFGGIGLDQAELNVYVNSDDNAIEDVSKITEKIPMTRAEVGDIVPNNAILVKEPSTYAFIETLPDDLKNGFYEKMLFTNKFMYIKFKKSEFGIIRISKANNLNTVGSYGTPISPASNLDCLFKIYGSQVPVGDVGDCVGDSETRDIIPLANVAAANDYINSYGIYFVADFNGYYYLAVTREGTYDVWSEVYVKTDFDGSEKTWTAYPAYYSFTIDKGNPNIDVNVLECAAAPCKSEKSTFTVADFISDTHIYNIGNKSIKFNIDKDYVLGTTVNRLLVIEINGVQHNAYDYSKKGSDPTSGNYIVFESTGVYTIKFFDGAKNSVTYKFIIDKDAPQITKIRDINNKNFNAYQQYVEVELEISEGSFLELVDGSMLVVNYWVDSGNVQEITVKNTNKECEIVTGSYQSGNCSVEDINDIKSLKLNVVIPINKDEADRDILKVERKLNVQLKDYFENTTEVIEQSFVFDNINPYLYFAEDYTPIKSFGENATNDDREKMITMDADSDFGDFNCQENISFTVGQDQIRKEVISCGDTPNMTGISNGVKVEAYEAYRVALNNVDASGEPIKNGTRLTDETLAYKKRYMAFANQSSLQSLKDTLDIYMKGAYIQVSDIEYIDPNKTYYTNAQGTESVSIKSLLYTYGEKYTGCDSNSTSECVLYKMYVTEGTFRTNQSFYVRYDDEYTLVTNKEDIDIEKYSSYYYDAQNPILDNGVYLPALITGNSCLKIGDNPCVMIEHANRIKLESSQEVKVIYYNIINISKHHLNGDDILISAISRITTEGNLASVNYAIEDTRIWQVDSSAKFRFGSASNLGRPIIFMAIDGAGNKSTNYIETVISIRDDIAPEIIEVTTDVYEVDVSEGLTLNNYKRVGNNFVKVNDGQQRETDVVYYIKSADRKNLGLNYLTQTNLVVEFNEPIYKVECSYYLYNTDTGDIKESTCSFHNEEYEYNEDKKIFELDYQPLDGELNYFINFRITVYDFSNNMKTVNSLFIDRESPVIKFNSNVNDEDEIETVYSEDAGKSKYDEQYVNSGFMSETMTTDKVNDRISSIGASNINNTFSYEIKYYAFNYNLTYNNYTFAGVNKDTPVLAINGIDKSAGEYYIKIKKQEGFIFRDIKLCEGEYCYIKDNYNYYPELIDNKDYWIEISENDYYIKNSEVGVYKIEYRVSDKSGNISDVLRKTVYCHDTIIPSLKVNGEIPSSKYGYHYSASLTIENEKQGALYVYKCKYGVTTCQLPGQIFASIEGTQLEMDSETNFEQYSNTLHDEENIYKIYFHDKGYYIDSIDGEGRTFKSLKYNYFEYTFLIDRTAPELYLNAFIDKYGNLYYHGYLNQEEYLYCVSGDRNGGDLSFGSQLVQCKESLAFAGEWRDPNDYVNMEVVYEYNSGTSNYELRVTNGNHNLYKDGTRYELDYFDGEYRYSDNNNSYIVRLDESTYKLKINNSEFVDFVETHIYKDTKTSISYKFIVDGQNYKLEFNSMQYMLSVGNNLYQLDYKEYSKTISDVLYKLVEFNENYAFYIDGENKQLTKVSENEYNYDDGVNLYRIVILNGSYTLHIGNKSEQLTANKLMTYSIRYRNGKYQIKVNDNKAIVRKLYNYSGELIYREEYVKLAANAQKYFYNTYYYRSGDALVAYRTGATYNEENVYMLESIDLYFRNDGKYILKAQDEAGNAAGRRTDSLNYDQYTSFIVDNSAPTYNKEQNKPTGINYWYSVPGDVITSDNMSNIRTVSKDAYATYYNIGTSGLNNSFFYAFSTKTAAKSYLTTIYSKHITSLDDNTCISNGKKGFNYSYYDPELKTIETKCFVGKDGKPNKNSALDYISETVFSKLVYPTFSGGVKFGDSSIRQVACDSLDSGNCITGQGMYKMVYLEVNYSDPENLIKNIVETCVENEVNKISCIKVNAKVIINDSTNGNSITVEVGGDNAVDTSSIIVYNKSTIANSSTSNSKPYTKTSEIPLNNNSYYIFEEVDATIIFPNYSKEEIKDMKDTVEHYNTQYYAVYIDGNDCVDVYHDEGNGIVDDSLTTTGIGTVKTNVDEYYLIIKNTGDSNFKNKYEIYEYWMGKNLVEVYSYLTLKIDGDFYNINSPQYLVKSGNTYYFKIPMQAEHVTEVELIDRAGNVTKITVSRSKVAPSINVSYSGEGGDQTATLIIEDSPLTKTIKDSIEVLFSTDKNDKDKYSTSKTSNIRYSLICEPGSSGNMYGCNNVGSANGINSYRVVISNLENLYGFFKINLYDNHGNTNSFEFMYNPADMSASYTANMRFIDNSMDYNNIRMISNDKIQLEFNNQVNYVILYKLSGTEWISVCNTKGIIEGRCVAGNDSNKVTREVDGEGQYLKSILYYVDEGKYKAVIVNRASEVIRNACFETGQNGTVKEDCKKITTSTSQICSWEENPDYCDDALEVIQEDVVQVYANTIFNKIEIDKTAPEVNSSNFVVNLPTGSQSFVNGREYTNAEIEVLWSEDFVQLVYSCTYIDSAEQCNGNSTGYMLEDKKYTFAISNAISTKYEFWFEDYAGNSTFNSRFSFTVNIELPEFIVYEVDENGYILQDKPVVDGSTIKNDAKLLCYVNGTNDDCLDNYDVKLFQFNGSGYIQIMPNDVTKVVERYDSKTIYKYTVSIKNVRGEPYVYLKKDFTFTIDKQAPNITLEGDLDPLWGIYRGEVRVMVSDDGKGTIYAGCVAIGEDERQNKIYSCNEEPLAEFTSNYTLSKTGIYKIIAEDEVGNVTRGDKIKYVNIDDEKPTVEIKVQGQYLSYNVAEKGYTNSSSVILEISDNNEGGHLKYRVKNFASNDVYGDWIIYNSNYLEVTEEGYYEIIPIDAVGNEGMERHFIIYRQAPSYSVNVQNTDQNTSKDIVDKSFDVTWSKNVYSYVAPIVKVTMNGKPYKAGTVIENPGEYTFVFTDLAGNVATHKVLVSNSKSICLDNVLITPKKQSLLYADNPIIEAGKYTFSDDDVILLVTPTYYFGGDSMCGADVLNYRFLNDEKSYILLDNFADFANANKGITLTLNEKTINVINELGGSAYVVIVSQDVARKELGLPIGENFFLKDPLGWSLVFIAGIGLLYVGIRLVFFRKKVRVLK